MNYKEVRKTLKNMSSSELSNLYEIAEIDDLEKWLLKYACIDERLALNTCAKLNISESTYYRMLPIALTKIYYTLKFI